MNTDVAYGLFRCPLHGCLTTLYPVTIGEDKEVLPQDLLVCDDIGVIEGVLPVSLFVKNDGVWSRWDHKGYQEMPRKWEPSKEPLSDIPENIKVWESYNHYNFIYQELKSVEF